MTASVRSESAAVSRIDRLNDMMRYDCDSGALYWVKGRARFSHSNGAGCVEHDGYLRFRLDGKKTLVHRAAWAMHYGVWPKDALDHIDGNRLNNRISNLREATTAQNMQNKGLTAVNKSGFKGVYFNKDMRKFHASIRAAGTKYHLGFFDSAEAASEAYIRAAQKLHGEFFNSGKVRK